MKIPFTPFALRSPITLEFGQETLDTSLSLQATWAQWRLMHKTPLLAAEISVAALIHPNKGTYKAFATMRDRNVRNLPEGAEERLKGALENLFARTPLEVVSVRTQRFSMGDHYDYSAGVGVTVRRRDAGAETAPEADVSGT